MCHFHTYLMGCKFTVKTDHKALLWMDQLNDSNYQLTCWSLLLQPFDFAETHVKDHRTEMQMAYHGCHGVKVQQLSLLPKEEGCDGLGTSPYVRNIVIDFSNIDFNYITAHWRLPASF